MTEEKQENRRVAQIVVIPTETGGQLYVLDSLGTVWAMTEAGWREQELPWTERAVPQPEDKKLREAVIKAARSMAKCHANLFNGEALEQLGELRDAVLALGAP